MHVFVGYDAREEEAYQVCRWSLTRDASGKKRPDVEVYPLEHRQLRADGLFDRPWSVKETGQFVDNRDGRPFSTDFSHSRFLVPEIARRMELTGLVLFVDCDFLFFRHPGEMLGELTGKDKAVWVVKHQFPEQADTVKMDGVVQQSYPKKLWSSLMLFNVDHPDCGNLDVKAVNWRPGSWLHQFGWTTDENIGEVPLAWNWVPTLSPSGVHVSAVHYSFGGPWMAGYAKGSYTAAWRNAQRSWLTARVRTMQGLPDETDSD